MRPRARNAVVPVGAPVLVGVVGIFAACAEGPVTWAGTVRDSAGVQLIDNPSSGLWDDTEAWIAIEDVRIGALDDPDYQFGDIVWLDVDQAGDIYVLDRMAGAVRVFAADGTFLRQIGRPGEGPGELGGSTSVLAVMSGDTIVVADPPRGLHRYDRDGTFVGSVPFAEPSWSAEALWGVGEGGALALQAREYYYWSDPPRDLNEAVVLLGPDLLPMDTVGSVPIDQWHLEGFGEECTFQPYAETYTWTISGSSSLHVASTAVYRVASYEQGRLTRVVTRDYDPLPLAAGERELLVQAQVNRWRSNGQATPDMIDRWITQFCFPDDLPPVSSVHVDSGGRLWVARPPWPSSLLDESTVMPRDWAKLPGSDWDVFDADGRFLGTVQFPEGFRAFAFREGAIYGAWQDEIGVPYVVRFRLTRGGTSSRAS